MKKIIFFLIIFTFSFTQNFITVDIPKGSSSASVAKILKENKLINHEFLFKIVAKLRRKESSFLAGRLKIDKEQSYSKIIDQLQDTKNLVFLKITFPEGSNLFRMDKKFAKEGFFKAGEFYEFTTSPHLFANLIKDIPYLKDISPQKLEGYLFPDTYFFEYGSDISTVVTTILQNFKDKVIPLYEESLLANKLPKKFNKNLTFNEIMTLASIVEDEAQLDKERSLISGVFMNRLNQRIILGSCSTIHYARAINKLPKTDSLSYLDTRINSDYNTYTKQGLPPTPISNPGLLSIKAALNPAKTDYLFFVSKGDKTHAFSKTEREHINNKIKYLGN